MSVSRIPGLNLYIGGIFGIQQAIDDKNITHVVSLVNLDQYFRFFSIDPDLFAQKDIKHLSIPVIDHHTEDLLRHFRTSIGFIRAALEEEDGKVLVHCGVGISRSATICIAYLLHTQPTRLTPKSALDLVRRNRSAAQPNPGFMEQLRLYHEMGCPLDPVENVLYQEWKSERGRLAEL